MFNQINTTSREAVRVSIAARQYSASLYDITEDGLDDLENEFYNDAIGGHLREAVRLLNMQMGTEFDPMDFGPIDLMETLQDRQERQERLLRRANPVTFEVGNRVRLVEEDIAYSRHGSHKGALGTVVPSSLTLFVAVLFDGAENNSAVDAQDIELVADGLRPTDGE